MKHNIEPITNEYYSCHQIILATYASYQQRDYNMIFAESWGFQYEKNDNPFCISMSPGYQYRRNALFENYHGIKINKEKYTNKSILLESVESILPSSPIILYCDAFDCPWNISYQRNHIDHYVLITGFNEITKQFYILDPYSTSDENIININIIAPSNGNILSFSVLPLKNISKEDYRLEIMNSLLHIDNSGFFQKFRIFRAEFITRFDEVISSEYMDVYAVPLILNLRSIANQRYCYCQFLNKCIDENIVNNSVVKMMENIAGKYSFLRKLLIKQIMKKKNSNECADIIDEIINDEYEVYQKMKSFKLT